MIRPEEMNIHVDSVDLPIDQRTENPIKFSIEEFEKKFKFDFSSINADELRRILNEHNENGGNLPFNFTEDELEKIIRNLELLKNKQIKEKAQK